MKLWKKLMVGTMGAIAACLLLLFMGTPSPKWSFFLFAGGALLGVYTYIIADHWIEEAKRKGEEANRG